jgi:hypothetical protein
MQFDAVRLPEFFPGGGTTGAFPMLTSACPNYRADMERFCDFTGFPERELESDPKEAPDDEAIEVYGCSDHSDSARTGSRTRQPKSAANLGATAQCSPPGKPSTGLEA